MEKKKTGPKPGAQYASKQYFFWNEKPYKVIKEHKRRNVVEAYDIIEDKTVSLPWTTWKKHKRPAFVTSQVANMLGRFHIRVRLWLSQGLVPKPFSLADHRGIEPGFGVTSVNFLWSEHDVLRAQEYMESTRRPDVPSRSEVLAMINQDKLVQYVRDDDTGEFYPVWIAQ